MRIAVITVSDKGSRGEREDTSGPLLGDLVAKLCSGTVVASRIVPDERAAIAAAITELARDADVVLTTGGTGVAARDVTPEATRDVITRELPGLGEIMRVRNYDNTPRAILSRGTAGTFGNTLVVNFPGSSRAIRECVPLVAPTFAHIVELLSGDSADCGSE
jgi:molybdopterin adenylyltransferase